MFRNFSICLLFCVLSIPVPVAAQSGTAASPQDKASHASARELSEAFRDAANRAIPATVRILAHAQTQEERGQLQVRFPTIYDSRRPRHPGDSGGTGVLIDPKGYVLTSNHVVARAKEIEVELTDGRSFFARKFRHDPETDLAVIWLYVDEGEELPYARFGDSDAMEIGDWVLALGNPFNLDLTVSAGIISAKGRSIPQVRRTEFLQTDAAINPGNSGGPLINLDGEIIGINTAIASRSGAYQGIAFALPSNNARWIAEQILRHDKVNRSWFGAVTKPLTPDHARRLKVKPGEGVLVDYVVQDSPAEKAHLASDDVILLFDDKPVNAVHQLERLTERADLDKEHEVVIVRDGKEYAAPVTLKPMPPSSAPAASNALIDGVVPSYVDNPFGILVVQPNPAGLRRLRVGNTAGVLVTDVIPGSRAARAGLETGMLITKVDGKSVSTRDAYIGARGDSSLSMGVELEVVLPGGAVQQIVIKL